MKELRILVDKWKAETERIKNKTYESSLEYDRKYMHDHCNILTYEYFIEQLEQAIEEQEKLEVKKIELINMEIATHSEAVLILADEKDEDYGETLEKLKTMNQAYGKIKGLKKAKSIYKEQSNE